MKITNLSILILTCISILLSSCIGDDFIDDFVDPEIRVTNVIDSLEVGTDYQFEADFFNNVGLKSQADIQWSSSAPDIITVTPSGLASALREGQSDITASVDLETGLLERQFSVVAGASTTSVTESQNSRSGVIETTTFYTLEGDFVLETNNQGSLTLNLAENFRASSNLPGLYVYLSNNPNSISGAHEVGEVVTFDGAHDYILDDNVGLFDYNYLVYFCKPFNVKVGDGEISE